MGESDKDEGPDESIGFVTGVLLITFAVIAVFILVQAQLASVLSR